MALPTITGNEIRYRLQTLTTLDISDTALASASFIPATDAYFNQKVGATATLTTDQTALIKAAKISHVCIKVVNAAPVEKTKTAVIDPKYIPAENKKIALRELKQECRGLMRMAGYEVLSGYVGSATHNDYDTLDLDNLPSVYGVIIE